MNNKVHPLPLNDLYITNQDSNVVTHNCAFSSSLKSGSLCFTIYFSFQCCFVISIVMTWERENRVREWRQSEDGRETNIKRNRLWESNNFCPKNDVILAAFSPARTQSVHGNFFFGKKGISLGYACSGTQAVSVSQQCPVWVQHPNRCTMLHRQWLLYKKYECRLSTVDQNFCSFSI